MGPPPSHHVMGPPGEPAQDNGLPGPPPAPATALVTTGPDGAPLDDGSQQSTLSNASAGKYFFLVFAQLVSFFFSN